MVRAFVAIALPPDHRRRLAGYLERCATLSPGYRWVAPESLHLTLRFAGNLEDAVAARLAAALEEVRAPAFDLRLGSLGSFGGRRPTVIWIGLEDGLGPASELAAGCERACRAVGLEPETRPFRPHLTLARARDRRGGDPIALPEPPPLAAWRVEEIVLYRSALGGGRPPVYTPIRSYPLEL